MPEDRGPERRSLADDVVDRLVPDGVEWRRWVRDYPVVSLGVAAVAGYVVARLHGRALVEGVSTLAADKVTANVQDLVDERIAETFR